MSHIIEHMFYFEIKDLMTRLLEIIKPKGILLIYTPCDWHGFHNDLDHIFPYPVESIINMANNFQNQFCFKYKMELVEKRLMHYMLDL